MDTRFIDLLYSLYKFYTTRVTYNTQQILWTMSSQIVRNRQPHFLEHTHITLSIPKIFSFNFYTKK